MILICTKISIIWRILLTSYRINELIRFLILFEMFPSLDAFNTNIVNCYYPRWWCAIDMTKLQYQQNMHSTPIMRSQPIAPAMSFPSRKSSLTPNLKVIVWLHDSVDTYGIKKKNSLGHEACGPSSVPSPQWFMPSHTNSDDIQNSVDSHLNCLHAWSIVIIHIFRLSQATSCKLKLTDIFYCR